MDAVERELIQTARLLADIGAGPGEGAQVARGMLRDLLDDLHARGREQDQVIRLP